MNGLRRTVIQFILFRLIFVTAIFIASIIIQFSTSTFLSLANFYWLIGTAYLLSLVYTVLFFLWKRASPQIYIQILFDLLWITAVVYISGGLQGTFYFLYIFEIIAASTILSRRAAYMTAALSCIFFGVLVDLMYLRVIPSYAVDLNTTLSQERVITSIFVAWIAFFLVAFLINHLTESLRKTRSALETAERELKLKERLALMGDVSAHLAHEIRNPLAAISGSVQVLRDDLRLSADQLHLMNIIIDESKRVSKSIEQFLSMASGPPNFSLLDLSSLLQETLILLRSSGDLDSRYSIAGNCQAPGPSFYGNGSQFKQLFWNIIRNALTAMPDGGILTIDFSGQPKSDVFLRFQDTGKGMGVDEQRRMFQPFYSTFKDGVGLGLSVVKRIVDDYDGTIGVSSIPDKGTEITITLPKKTVGRNRS